MEKGAEAEQAGNHELLNKVDQAEEQLEHFVETGEDPLQQRSQQEREGRTVTVDGRTYRVTSQKGVAQIYAKHAEEKGYTVTQITPQQVTLTQNGETVTVSVPAVFDEDGGTSG